MSMDFFEAAEIEGIVADLIERHHKPLRNAHIRCLFTTKTKKVDGVELIAWTKKLDPLAAYLSGTARVDHEDLGEDDGSDFALIVDFHQWTHLKDPNKERVIHHEIFRMCGGPGKWALADHDFDGFFAELRLYGPWHDRLQWMARTLEQQELPLEQVPV